MIALDLTIVRGEFRLEIALRSDARRVGVYGPNGAGKSTLLEAICGVLRPERGRIEVDGAAMVDTARGVSVGPEARGIGVAFQDGRLLPDRTAAANLDFPVRCGRRGVATRAEVVDALELGPLLGRRPGALSGGERQRVAIGRAVLAAERLLLLDEPLAAVERRLWPAVIALVRDAVAARGVPVLHVSHDLGELADATEELAILGRGGIVAVGRSGELVHDPAAGAILLGGGLANRLGAVIDHHDLAAGTSLVRLADGTPLIVPLIDAEIGRGVRLAIAPREIALASRELTAISIRNQCAARVSRLSSHERMTLVEVELSPGGPRLLAEVSRAAVDALRLAPGVDVVALIKTQGVRAEPA